MGTCTREGCNNEARKPRKPVPPGQEGWCGDCRLRLEPPASQAPAPRPRKIARKARPVAKVKPGLASVKLPRTTSIGDIVKAYELVMSVGLEVCQALAESSGK